MAINVKVHAAGLLDYAKAGKEAVKRIKTELRGVANVARTDARQRINREFKTRTGFLRRQARNMQTSVTVTKKLIAARAKPIPRLMNIFEGGATLSNGRGTLRARPVIAPAQRKMELAGYQKLNRVLAEVGK